MAHLPFRHRSGFLLLEILIGVAVFSIFVAGAVIVMLLGQEASFEGGDRIRATHMNERALEVAKTRRLSAFSNLPAGIHGVALDPSTTWVLSGTYASTFDGFRTELTITSLASDWVELSAKTTWARGNISSGTVTTSLELTDWITNMGGDWSAITLEGEYTDDEDVPLFNDIAINGSGTYAFVSSDESDGDGLYVFDISDLSDPIRVASSFDLDDHGYDLVADGTTLYILVDDNNAELQVYDISDPVNFSSADLLDTYNLPGNGLGLSLALDGTTLYVGAIYQTQGGRYELYSFDVSNPSSIILLDDMDDSGSVYGIALNGTSAYLALSDDTLELRLADITGPSSLSTVGGYNATDTQDGSDVLVVGTGVVLSRMNGGGIEELIRVDIASHPDPSPPPGPWVHEIGGTVNDMEQDMQSCAGFLATDNSSKELQVVNARGTSLAELDTYDSDTGDGRGVHYDLGLDRLFFVTNSQFIIFKPAAGPWVCP